MLFRDGTKIDLTLIKLDQAEAYFASDPLIKVILDKDGIAPELPDPTDDAFRVERPSEECVTDCANEFYFSSTYVQRALFRKELQTVRQLMEHRIHPELLRMLSWLAGARGGFPVNIGKYYRWLYRYLSEEEQGMLSAAYDTVDIPSSEEALRNAMELFGKSLAEVCGVLNYTDPGYYSAVMGYIRTLMQVKENGNEAASD
jgi:aminoglycoside 6-adenylyltransferase